MAKTKIDLDGKTWLQYSISIWSDIRKSSEENGLAHPAIFPIMLPERLIKIYSHEGDLIFDPFAGSGSTLIAAKNLKRHSKGIELSDDFIKLYKDEFYPFHTHIIDFMLDIGFSLDDIIIWDRRQEYNNLRPLGYPYVFRINKVHEFILVFKRCK
ncbi:MAG: site-specific DNA-methyltransferase [candidate division KSB1 bacterium]|nr:site-specific DNA-methyltransferase [candidate division KSB1 bacterium]